MKECPKCHELNGNDNEKCFKCNTVLKTYFFEKSPTVRCKTCETNITNYAHKYCDKCYKKARRLDIRIGIACILSYGFISTILNIIGIYPGVLLTIALALPTMYFFFKHNKDNFVKGNIDITSDYDNTANITVYYNNIHDTIIIMYKSAVLYTIKNNDNEYNSNICKEIQNTINVYQEEILKKNNKPKPKLQKKVVAQNELETNYFKTTFQTILNRLDGNINDGNPSCKSVMMKAAKNFIDGSKASAAKLGKDYDFSIPAYQLVYDTAFELLASGEFHIYRGKLNPMNESSHLYSVLIQSLDWFVEHKHLTNEEKEEELQKLRECIRNVG